MVDTLEHDIGAAVWSGYDPDGFLTVQIDAFGEGDSGLQPYELHHPLGFSSRPRDPDTSPDGTPGQACRVLYATQGGVGHAWLAYDPRAIPGLPALQKGESMQYGCAGQFIRCHADGSVTIFTTDAGGDPRGRSVYMKVKPDGFVWVAPWGKATFDSTGFHVLTSSGARLDLGAIGGLPSPLDAIGSYLNMQAGIVNIRGGMISLGDADGAEPAAKAQTLLEDRLLLVTAIQLLITAVSSATLANPAAVGSLALLVDALNVPPDILSSTTVS